MFSPKVNSIKKASGKMVGYPPTFPEMGHGGKATLGHPASKTKLGNTKKPNK